jgi:hypothetical protein
MRPVTSAINPKAVSLDNRGNQIRAHCGGIIKFLNPAATSFNLDGILPDNFAVFH